MSNTKLLSPSPQGNSDRLNPEFIGIGKELVKTHYQRREAQLQEKQLSNRVAFLQKEQQQAQRKLMKKQSDLERLMAVIARKQADEEERERMRQEKEASIAQRREENLKKRHEHQDKIRNAYLSLYGENRQASEDMRRTFNRYEEMRETMRAQERRDKESRVINISLQKSEGKKRVDSFYKSRNDAFTDHYKCKIQQEKEVAGTTNAQIENLSSIETQLRLRLEASNSKLHEMEQRYTQTYLTRLPTNRSFLSKHSKSFILPQPQSPPRSPSPPDLHSSQQSSSP